MDTRQQLEAMYKKSRDMQVKSLANRMGGAYNAEDVVQEAYLRALIHIDTYNPEKATMETWFNRILKRASYDFKRQELQQGLVRDEMDKDEPYENFRSLGFSTMREVAEEIGKKNDKHKEVLTLAFIKSYRPREISAVVDENIGNINGIIARFKKEMEMKYA